MMYERTRIVIVTSVWGPGLLRLAHRPKVRESVILQLYSKKLGVAELTALKHIAVIETSTYSNNREKMKYFSGCPLVFVFPYYMKTNMI